VHSDIALKLSRPETQYGEISRSD